MPGLLDPMIQTSLIGKTSVPKFIMGHPRHAASRCLIARKFLLKVLIVAWSPKKNRCFGGFGDILPTFIKGSDGALFRDSGSRGSKTCFGGRAMWLGPGGYDHGPNPAAS